MGLSLEEAWIKAKNDPVFFARWLLGFNPTDYQARLLRDNSKRVVVRWCRQSGKSTTLAVKALWFAVFHPNTTTLIVSPSLRQSVNLRDIVAGLIGRMPEDARGMVVCRVLRTTIYFWGDSRIVALPANPETLRGYTAHMILVDEADFFQDPETIFYGTLYPMLTSTDGWLIVSSTPWSKKGFFYKICHSNLFSQHVVGWVDAVKAGIAKREVVEEAKTTLPPELFKREYLCEFVEDSDVFLPSDLIAKCVDSKPLDGGWDYYPLEAKPKGNFYVGCDFGKKQDYSVVAVFDKRDDETLRLVHLHRFQLETPYSSVIGYIKTLCENFRDVYAVYCDVTGVGEYIVEEMQRIGIPNVFGVNFTRQSKEAMAIPFKQAMLNGKIRIPYDRNLINELNIEKYEVTKDGHYIFSHPEGSHDDQFWALVLAYTASLKSSGGILIGGMKKPSLP